jgi:hypothetical protein
MANRAERRRAERLGLALPAAPTRCRIELEGWESEFAKWVWTDPRPQALQRGFIELAELLHQLVDDPAVVTLVIPVDVADAVQRREPDVPYTLERGSGIVGGRTMSMPDGRIDVIINGGPLLGFDQDNVPILRREPLKLISRGVVHEAQHVVMRQRGSGFEGYDVEAVEGSRQLAGSAAILCDEHRAEWQAIQLTEPELPTVGDVTAVLETLGRQLFAANETYQATHDQPDAVRRLAVAVFTACAPFWTSLAYWTAQHRTNDTDITEIPGEIAALPLWKRYGGDVWSLLQDNLLALPVEDLTTSRGVLSTAAQLVAATLASSLQTIGFRYEETDAGWAFHITRFDFPDQ